MSRPGYTTLHPNHQYHARILRWKDGDSLVVEIITKVDHGFSVYSEHTHQLTIRLKNIDTPEKFHPRNKAEKEHGLAATEFVNEFMPVGSIVTMQSYRDRSGKYGRYLAEFTRDDGKVLSEELKANGFEKRATY